MDQLLHIGSSFLKYCVEKDSEAECHVLQEKRCQDGIGKEKGLQILTP